MKALSTVTSVFLLQVLLGNGVSQTAPSVQASAAAVAATLPVPAPVPGPAHADKAALAEISEYEALTFSPGNSVITITGHTTIGEPKQNRTYGSSMILSADRRFRFDVHSPQEQSIRSSGALIKKQEADGKTVALPETLFGSPYVSSGVLKQIAANPAISIEDHGTLTVDGKQMHRITLSTSAKTIHMRPLCADLYFNAGTHLLTYSVAPYFSSTAQRFPINQVVQYDMYSPENGVEMPHRFILSGNGVPGLTFIAEQVSTTNSADNTQFQF